jgi:hypothetical protein
MIEQQGLHRPACRVSRKIAFVSAVAFFHAVLNPAVHEDERQAKAMAVPVASMTCKETSPT